MKQVRETKAGKSVAAWVVLRADGTHVATVQAHYSDAGAAQVDVWNFDATNPTRVRMDAAKAYGPQQGRAGGYGYDKLVAALSGMEIDGHRLTDHCGESLPLPEGMDHFPEGYKAPAGYSLANWTSEGYRDCYRLACLEYLQALGYRVIQAI